MIEIDAEVLAICRAVLEDGTITVDSTTETLPQWDSLAHMNLITALEERFGVELDVLEMAEVDGVRSLIDVVRNTVGRQGESL